MKFFTLCCIILSILILAYLFCGKFKEAFGTPNPYIISWSVPGDDGGDPDMSYDWKICSDAGCATVIDSGTNIPALTTSTPIPASTYATTSKLDWNTTYYIQVRANNMFGSGVWTTATLSTGDGVAAISIASSFDSNGKPVVPLSVGPAQNIAVWTTLINGSVDPNTSNASALITIVRGGATVLTQRLPLSATGLLNKIDTFHGDFESANISLPAIENGDKVTAVVLVWDSNGNVQTESSAEFTVSQTVPGNVSGIALTYAN